MDKVKEIKAKITTAMDAYVASNGGSWWGKEWHKDSMHRLYVSYLPDGVVDHKEARTVGWINLNSGYWNGTVAFPLRDYGLGGL